MSQFLTYTILPAMMLSATVASAQDVPPPPDDATPTEQPRPNIDTDGDGLMDAWDLDEDGVVDAVDSDGDGVADTYVEDEAPETEPPAEPDEPM